MPQALELRFDELLWSFTDRSFVPHEHYADAQQWQRNAPCCWSCQRQPQQSYDLLVNLGDAIPRPQPSMPPGSLNSSTPTSSAASAGRNRFRQYRDRGVTPQTRNLRRRGFAFAALSG